MMHWDNRLHDGPGGWGWMMMALMMIAFWVGVVWIIASVVRHRSVDSGSVPLTTPAPPGTTGPEDILHERFARGDIDVEEYHHRLDAMRAKQRS